MTPRTADRLFRAVMVLAIVAFVAVVVAATGCHAPRPGYGTPRHPTAVTR